jgi:CubicO group peptidase (beta-lactamase class C family)
VHVEHDDGAWCRAVGAKALEPEREPLELDTVYDCASLTKVVVTAPIFARLMHEAVLHAHTPVRALLPGFAGGDAVSVADLLSHVSGLPASLPLDAPWSGTEAALALACAATPTHPAGTFFRYSDVNFILLAAIAERVTGRGLVQLAQDWIFEPLAMHDSGFRPLQRMAPGRIAPTERDDAHGMLRGVVHDPTARRMGGVSGHAGLFSTAADLARFARMVVVGGRFQDRVVLPEAAVARMTTVATPEALPQRRSLGWDVDSPLSRARGHLYPLGSVGHTGFTGCALWIDRQSGGFHVLLSNRVHPVARASIVDFYERVATLAARAVLSTD